MRLTPIFLLLASNLSAQSDIPAYNMVEPTAENFHRAMDLTEPSALQIDSIISLSIEYSYSSEDSCLILGERAVEMGSKQDDQPVYGRALLELGDSYRIFGDLSRAETLLVQGKEIYHSLDDERQVAYADNKLGALSQNRGDYEAAVRYYLNALATARRLQDTSNIINTSLNVGWSFNVLKRLDKAEEFNGTALRLAEITQDEQPIMYAVNNAGLIFREQARRYSEMADTASLAPEVYQDSTRIYLNRALQSHERSMALARKRSNTQSVIRSLINMAEIQDEQGDYRAALSTNSEADRLIGKVGDIVLSILIKRNFAEIYRHTQDYSTSIDYGKQALHLAKANELEGYIAGSSDQLYQACKAAGQYEEALMHYETFQEFRTKNDAAEKTRAIAEVEARYQNVQKEKQILELQYTNATIEKQRNYLLGGALLLSILGFFGFQFNKVRSERNDKRAFAEALIYAQENERRRIARDLHDGVGQSLLLLRKQFQTTQQITRDNQLLIAETLEEVRAISRDLHPFQLEKFGLAAAIESAISKVEESAGLFITREIAPVDGLFSPEAEINIYRAIQEALSNVVKHAEATAAKVSIQTEDNGQNIKVNILDNGKGFDTELSSVPTKSLGLRTMQERITNIGGKFRIARNAPSGTAITFTVPTNRN